MTDLINSPSHYNSLPVNCPCGRRIECKLITGELNFNLGSAIKYLWRADYKENPIQDLKKAAKFIKMEIERRTTIKENPIVPEHYTNLISRWIKCSEQMPEDGEWVFVQINDAIKPLNYTNGEWREWNGEVVSENILSRLTHWARPAFRAFP